MSHELTPAVKQAILDKIVPSALIMSATDLQKYSNILYLHEQASKGPSIVTAAFGTVGFSSGSGTLATLPDGLYKIETTFSYTMKNASNGFTKYEMFVNGDSAYVQNVYNLSTVIHGIKKIQNLIKEDSKISQQIYEIESRL